MMHRRLAALFELDSHGPRILPLEGLRGLCAFLVFLVHFGTLLGHFVEGTATAGVLAVLSSAGNCGVDVFFAISAYLIYGQLLPQPFSYARFLRRRVIRLYPAFLVLFAIFVIERSITGRLPAPPALLANFLMLPTMLPIEPMIVHAWSLSYEVLFYLTLPLLVRYLEMPAWPAALRAAFWAGLALLSLGLTYIGRNTRPRLVAFCCGLLLYEIVRQSNQTKFLGNVLALAAFTAAILTRGFNSAQPVLFGHDVLRIHSSFLFSSLFLGTLLLCYFALSSRGFLHRWLSSSPLRYFGNMSYSFYLLHGSVLHILNEAAPRLGLPPTLGPIAFLSLLLATFVLSSIPAAALFLLVEKPMSFPPRLPSAPRQ